MRYLALLMLLSGCGGQSASQLADAHRATASAKLSKIAALAPLVASQPQLTEDAWQLPDGVRLDFVPFAERYAEDGGRLPNPTYNAAIAFDHQLAKPSTAEPVYWGSHDHDLFFLMVDHSQQWLIEPACLLDTGRGRYGSEPVIDNLKSGLDWLERTKYVLVLRVPTRQPPGLVMEELKAGEMKSFTGGHVLGDAILYDVETGACLGGIAVDVESGSELEVRNTDVHGQLRRDLAGSVDALLKEKLGKVGVPPR